MADTRSSTGADQAQGSWGPGGGYTRGEQDHILHVKIEWPTPPKSRVGGFGFHSARRFRTTRTRVPPPVRHNAYTLLGLPYEGCTIEHARQRYRELAMVIHPDAGGDNGWMVVLNRAYDEIRL